MNQNSASNQLWYCLLAIAIGVPSIFMNNQAAQAQPAPETKIPQPEVGFEFEGQRDLNFATITNVEYRGECPGKKAGTVAARFTSSANPPATGQRVVIQNVTRGMQVDSPTSKERGILSDKR